MKAIRCQLSDVAAAFLFCCYQSSALELRVVDSAQRQPLTGTSVEWNARGEKKTVIVDADGKAVMGVPSDASGTLQVTARKSGFTPMTMRWAAEKVPAQFELRLPEAQFVGGRVVDESGAPVVGANISLIIPQRLAGPFVAEQDLSAKTDTNGTWRCEVVPKDSATYGQVEVTHPDFETSAVSLEQSAQLKLVPVATVEGRVTDEAGNAVASAEVVMGDERGIWPGSSTAETTTDAHGHFEFRRVPLKKRLLGVKADNAAPALQLVDVRRKAPPLELRLTRGAPLLVRVVNEAGKSLNGVDAHVDEWPSGIRTPRASVTGRWAYPGWEWRTDAEGRFIWSNAPAGIIDFTFRKGGYMSKSRHGVEATPGEQIVTLGQSFQVSGKVTDADTGKAIPEFVMNARFASISGLGNTARTNYGSWYDHNRKRFKDGQFSATYDHPLLSGSAQMHDWQFQIEADGYESAVSRVVRDTERGANLEVRLHPRSMPEIVVAAPSPTNRVTAAIAIQPTRVRYGETFTVFVKARVAPGFYIYALEDSGSRNLPSSLSSLDSRHFKEDGAWRSPQPKVRDDGSRALAGDILFERRFVLIDHGAGGLGMEKVPVELRFQVCNEALCWPPETIRLETKLETLLSQ